MNDNLSSNALQTVELLYACRSLSNPQIVPRMVRTISNLHGGSLPRDASLSDYDTTGEFVMLCREI